jgi:hypothetical protein
MSNTKTVNVTAFVFMAKGYARNAEGNYDYCAPEVWEPEVWKCKVDDSEERIFVSEQTVTVEVPVDFDYRPALIKALEAEKEKARADFAARVTSLDRRINELLAIEG